MNVLDTLNEAGKHLSEHRITEERIDEVALLFHSEIALEMFTKDAEAEHTWEHFNSVPSDLMRRQDLIGSFQVRFEFFRPATPVVPPWRVEAMCVLEGDAPLHRQTIARSLTLPAVVHVSYKLEDLDAYQKEVRGLWEQGVKMEAEYSNSYGMFSYWRLDGVFLKPRVNLRDT